MDETLAFYVALGFAVTSARSDPTPTRSSSTATSSCISSCRRCIPDGCYHTCYVLEDDVDALYDGFVVGPSSALRAPADARAAAHRLVAGHDVTACVRASSPSSTDRRSLASARAGPRAHEPAPAHARSVEGRRSMLSVQGRSRCRSVHAEPSSPTTELQGVRRRRSAPRRSRWRTVDACRGRDLDADWRASNSDLPCVTLARLHRASGVPRRAAPASPGSRDLPSRCAGSGP